MRAQRSNLLLRCARFLLMLSQPRPHGTRQAHWPLAAVGRISAAHPPPCFYSPEPVWSVSTGRDSPRRATYFLGTRQESRQRNAPRRLGPSGFPRSGRFRRPVLNSLRSNSRTGLPRRNHPPLGEPEGNWVAAVGAVTYTLGRHSAQCASLIAPYSNCSHIGETGWRYLIFRR